MKEPILIVGLGGAGSKLASQAADRTGAGVLVISNDQADLGTENAIKVSTAPVINPTVQLIRSAGYRVQDEIRAKMAGYTTIVLMANLAGKAGSALAPVVSQICKEEGKETISFAIMPFRYEKDRIFNSGIALKRLRSSGCTIILDNDALFESNPSLSPSTCFDIANKAILHVADSLKTSEIDSETSILAAGTKSRDIEESLRDALKMLYNDAPPGSIKRSIIHVAGGNDIPVGVINSITNITSGVLQDSSSQVSMESALEESSIVMLSGIQGMTKFDRYDALGAIPQKDTLDWSEPECSIDCKMELYQLE